MAGRSCSYSEIGSPPLTRGKAESGKGAVMKVGITPAYAGKSSLTIAEGDGPGDHPRLRGEKRREHAAADCREGSPPLTRGKGLWGYPRCFYIRITPAYAGKSFASLFSALIARDHPRLRGEKSAMRGSPARRTGSPPLTRGKVAGSPGWAAPARDHPRLRGEKIYLSIFFAIF